MLWKQQQRRQLWLAAAASAAAVLLTLTGSAWAASAPGDAEDTEGVMFLTDSGKPDYAQALAWNFMYYEAARSGKLPEDNRIEWRGDSNVDDSTTVKGKKLDLSGGYHDAGDHLKITMPLAVTLSQIGWSMLEFEDEYKATGQWDKALEMMKWGLDWLLKAAFDKQGLVVQVGSGASDHKFWGPPERMDMKRPALIASADKPAADVAADVAAALAVGSMVFEKEGDSEYSKELLQTAERMYDFSVKYNGRAAQWMPTYDARLYNSSHEEDDMMWAAAWLYRATGEDQYYDDARTLFSAASEFAKYWPVWNWDNMYWGALVVMQKIERDMDKEPDLQYQEQLDSFFSSWMNGDRKANIIFTEEGLACIDMWGVMRNTINAASLAFLWGNNPPDAEKARELRCWAQSQVDFALGQNDRNQSYVVGWGEQYPQQPHFRAAACADWEDQEVECGEENFNKDKPSPHLLKGAMVFGQCATWFRDNRTNPETNEVALDGNAGLAGALAALSSTDNHCTGEPFLPPAERPPPEEAKDNAAGRTHAVSLVLVLVTTAMVAALLS